MGEPLRRRVSSVCFTWWAMGNTEGAEKRRDTLPTVSEEAFPVTTGEHRSWAGTLQSLVAWA